MQEGHFGILKSAIAARSGELQIEQKQWLNCGQDRAPPCQNMHSISGAQSKKNYDVSNINFIHLKVCSSARFADRALG